MRRTLAGLAVGLAFVGLGLTACTEDPLEPQSAALRADARPADDIFDMDVIQSVSGNGHIRIRIECLHVVGNQAWASGTVVVARDPNNIGRPYAVRFVDNGEGANAEPAEFGADRFGDLDCTTEPDLLLRQLTIGNLVIRGG